MRETRNTQTSIFENYSEHEYGMQLKQLSELLDDYPQLVDLVALDLDSGCRSGCVANGLTSESVFRCLVLKQLLQVSYERLAFHLSDSDSYRTFARLEGGRSPKRSSLQSTIRRINAGTLEKKIRYWWRVGVKKVRCQQINYGLTAQ